MPITAFGIRFSDNDFTQTLTPWVESFVRMLCHRGYVPSSLLYSNQGREITKEQIEDLFSETIGAFYLMHQADTLKGNEEVIDYLQTHSVHIYLNEEVGEYVTKCGGWDNSEFYFWFFDPYDPCNVSCI